MKPTIVYKTYHPVNASRYYGDQLFLKYQLEGLFNEVDNFPEDKRGVVIVIKGGDNWEYVDKLNADIAKYHWVIILITGIEQGHNFYTKIKHPNMRIWLQTPRSGDKADWYIPVGYPTYIKPYLPVQLEKIYDVSFAGQNTHERRQQCIKVLESLPNTFVYPTEGFNQGMKYPEYIKTLAQSKLVACPGGAMSPDSFRVYEALEAGSIPVVDKHSGYSRYEGDFWEKLFPNNPLLKIDNWNKLPTVLDEILANYDNILDLTMQWWAEYKQKFVSKLLEDIYFLENNK